MKRIITISTLFALSAGFLLLIGCASVPVPGVEDSLLLINREKTGQFDSYYSYHIYIDGDEEPYIDFKASSRYLLVQGLEPGTHTINAITLTDRRSSGEWVLPNSAFSFELKGGYVTILERTHFVEMRKESDSSSKIWYSENPELIPLTSEAAEELIEKFRKADKNGLWKF